jgi:hypothetical protein
VFQALLSVGVLSFLFTKMENGSASVNGHHEPENNGEPMDTSDEIPGVAICVPSRDVPALCKSFVEELKFWRRGLYADESAPCTFCNGYYGPNFTDPVCATCHSFVYPRLPDDEEIESPLEVVKPEDDDSGNEEPEPEALASPVRARVLVRISTETLSHSVLHAKPILALGYGYEI